MVLAPVVERIWRTQGSQGQILPLAFRQVFVNLSSCPLFARKPFKEDRELNRPRCGFGSRISGVSLGKLRVGFWSTCDDTGQRESFLFQATCSPCKCLSVSASLGRVDQTRTLHSRQPLTQCSRCTPPPSPSPAQHVLSAGQSTALQRHTMSEAHTDNAHAPLCHLTESLDKVVRQKSIPAQIHQYLMLVMIKVNLTNLCGHELLRSNFIKTFGEIKLTPRRPCAPSPPSSPPPHPSKSARWGVSRGRLNRRGQEGWRQACRPPAAQLPRRPSPCGAGARCFCSSCAALRSR